MLKKAQKEDRRWVLDRATAYSDALKALGQRKFGKTYRYLLEAERLVLDCEGNPPGVISSESTPATSAEIIAEASSFDPDYDIEHFEHHAPRVRCFFHKSILICFKVCEAAEIITMTGFELPSEVRDDLRSSSTHIYGGALPPKASRSGFIMELGISISNNVDGEQKTKRERGCLFASEIRVSKFLEREAARLSIDAEEKWKCILSKYACTEDKVPITRSVRTFSHHDYDFIIHRYISAKRMKSVGIIKFYVRLQIK